MTAYPLETRAWEDGWAVTSPVDYLPLLKDADPLRELVAFALERGITHGFRREVELAGLPVLVAVLPQEKLLLLSSRRLSRELLLLETQVEEPLLQNHVNRVGTLDTRYFPTEWEWVTWKEKLADWNHESEWTDVEALTAQKLAVLVKQVQRYQPTLFERISDWGLGLTATFALIRIHLLKFLAMLPSMDHDKKGHEVKKTLIESLRRLSVDNQRLRDSQTRIEGARPLPRRYTAALELGHRLAQFLPAGPLAFVVRSMVKKMARRFIAGESIASSDETLQVLYDSGRDATLDQLGELVVSEEEADEYLRRVLAIIQGLKIHIIPGERNRAGIPRAHVSIKVSALTSRFKPEAFETTYTLVAPRLRKILTTARQEKVFVNIDAEHYHYRNLVLALYRRVLLETPELAGWSDTGIVLQAYLRDGAPHLRKIVDLARERGVRIPIRLVKGAYWDAETIEAEVHSHHAPQFLNKEESDLHFRQLAEMALGHSSEIQLVVGSHNLLDHCLVEALRELRHPEAPVIEHQCLHMTYEALSHGLAEMGWPTRNYMPIGNLLVGMAYLVRRIMENSSQVGVLTIMRSHNKSGAFKTPLKTHQEKKAEGAILRDSLEARPYAGFKNCTPARLYVETEREAFAEVLEKCLAHVRSQQSTWKEASGTKIWCSSEPSLMVGVVQESTPAQVQKLLGEFTQGFASGNDWSERKLAERIVPLARAADVMWRRRNELSAMIVLEAGKSWAEALGDVDEAIDFIHFYCREEVRSEREHPGRAPRGVTVAIAPWNFPLAIPCGMVVAPLVAGNPVILKPAEQTPLIAQALVELLWEAGIPKTALALVLGDGEKVGAPMVSHPEVAAIVFTGSKGVGKWIYRTAASQFRTHPQSGRRLSKKVITEMGGKNAILVTNNCEQDETVSGILYAAFAHAGQKCSAASRVLVDAEVKDALLARLVKAVKDVQVGPATDPRVLVNPLISAADQARVREAAREACAEALAHGGKVWVDRSLEDCGGYTVAPVVVELPAARAAHPDSWAQREVFGPMIHVVPYTTLDEAVQLFNGTEYALTGGIYGQSQDDIDALSARLECGNLYVNRPNTGARVAIEPFGGFKMSGTGPKAGGRDYLNSFHVEPGHVSKAATSFTWVEDSGYRWVTPQVCTPPWNTRMVRLEKIMQQLLARLDVLFGRVSEDDKRTLRQFSDWLSGPAGSVWVMGQHPNLHIPGQLGFDRKDLPREAALFVLADPVPTTVGLMHLISALTAGSGVGLACVSEGAWSSWKQVADIFWRAGVPKGSLEIYRVGQKELASVLNDSNISVLYAAGPETWVEETFQQALSPDGIKRYMRALHGDHEHPAFHDGGMWLDQYLWTRSFAVNTMRHGAPLELGL